MKWVGLVCTCPTRGKLFLWVINTKYSGFSFSFSFFCKKRHNLCSFYNCKFNFSLFFATFSWTIVWLWNSSCLLRHGCFAILWWDWSFNDWRPSHYAVCISVLFDVIKVPFYTLLKCFIFLCFPSSV